MNPSFRKRNKPINKNAKNLPRLISLPSHTDRTLINFRSQLPHKNIQSKDPITILQLETPKIDI